MPTTSGTGNNWDPIVQHISAFAGWAFRLITGLIAKF